MAALLRFPGSRGKPENTVDRLTRLREERAATHAEIERILSAAEKREKPGLTADERTEVDGLEARYDEQGAEIEREERRISRTEQLNGVAGKQIRGADDFRAPAAPETGKVTEFRDIGGDRGLGDFLYSVRFNPGDERLASLHAERREQSMGEGDEGGFAVPVQVREGLLEVAQQGSIFRPGATVIPAGSPPDAKIEMVALDQSGDTNMYGGVEVSWIGEGDPKPATDYKIRQVVLQPNEVAAHIVLTDKILRNWQASGPLAGRLLRSAAVAAEDQAFYNGDGNGKPQGMVGASATIAINRANATTFAYADAVGMLSVLRMGGSPVWVMSQSVLPQLLTMEDGDGRLLWQPNGRDGAPGTLLGYPVLFNERSALLGAKGDVMLADRSYYLIKDGSGPFVATSPHVHFTSNKTVIKMFWNVDGQPWLTAPIEQEGGYEVSPFVALDVPS
jgi:HK97 family phage major capsid protein